MTENPIYLVLDMMNDIVSAEGVNANSAMGLEVKARDVIAKTKHALVKARAAGVMVGYVRVGFSHGYPECPSNSPVFTRARESGIYLLDTWGTEIHKELTPLEGDVDIVKHRISPFYATKLESVLRANYITKIYMSGVSTTAVVQSTVRDGHDRDYDCVVLEDCCASASAEDHTQSISMIRRFAQVTTSNEVKF